MGCRGLCSPDAHGHLLTKASYMIEPIQTYPATNPSEVGNLFYACLPPGNKLPFPMICFLWAHTLQDAILETPRLLWSRGRCLFQRTLEKDHLVVRGYESHRGVKLTGSVWRWSWGLETSLPGLRCLQTLSAWTFWWMYAGAPAPGACRGQKKASGTLSLEL